MVLRLCDLINTFNTFLFFFFSLSPFPAPVSTIETVIGRAPFSDDAFGANSNIYNTYEPSSQIKYSSDKYLIAEKIQNALRQQPVQSQVCNVFIQ